MAKESLRLYVMRTSHDMPMKVKNKVSSFLCLHNDIISKNLLLLNIGISNVLKNNSDGDGAWICQEQD